MSIENDVFRKIKEMSKREMNPRPSINVNSLAQELNTSSDSLVPWLGRLKDLRLVNYNGNLPAFIRLTLLGTVVQR